MKRLLAFFIAFMMIFSSVDINVFARTKSYSITNVEAIHEDSDDYDDYGEMTEEEFCKTSNIFNGLSTLDSSATAETGLYKSQLTDKTLEFYNCIEEAGVTRSNPIASITLTCATDEQETLKTECEAIWATAMYAYYRDHYDTMCWARNNISYKLYYGWSMDGSYAFVRFDLTYIVSDYYTDDTESELDTTIASVVNGCTATSRYDKVMYYHDWLVNNNVYDYDALTASQTDEIFYYAHSPVGCLIKGEGVCESYAKAFKLFCIKEDIPCLEVTSSDHAWDLVKMNDNEWYMVDCTWDDPGSTGCDYDYFLVSNNPYIDDHHTNDSTFDYPETPTTAYDNTQVTHTYGDPVITYEKDEYDIYTGEVASVTFTCSDCGETIEGAWITDISDDDCLEPTCNEEGYLNVTVKCWYSGDDFDNDEDPVYTATEKLIIPATGEHTYTSTVTAPTCTAKGYTTCTCSVCGNTYTDDETAALGHNYTSTITTSPTCTKAGVRTYTCTRCNDSYTEDIAATGHSYTSAVTKPTCTTQGYTTHTCSICGNSYVDSYTEASGHTWNTGTVVTTATCKNTGLKTYICNTCGATKNEVLAIDSTNHTGNTEVKNAKAATCGVAGYTGDTYCADCNTLLTKGTTIAATGNHTWNAGVVTKEATEDETGVMTYTCTVCGETKTEEIAKTDHVHNYTAVVTAPTCTTKGYTTYTCAKCGDSYTSDETAALGHNYTSAVTTAATCTTEGVRTYTCTRCDDSYTETIEATGHSYKDVVTSPTCTKQGYTTHTCTLCGDSYVDSYTNALGHNLNDGVVTKEATCEETGVLTCTCTRCGNIFTRTIDATGHTAVKHAAVAATCTTTGMKAYYECSVCGKYFTDAACSEETTLVDLTVAALGHSYKDVVTSPTCTTKGYTTHTCTVCGNSYVDSYTDALGHTWNDGTVTTKATCISKGVKTYTCTVCDETKTEEIAIDASNHTGNTVVKNAKDATCGEAGYTGDTYCKDCDTLLTKGTTIDATGDHTWNAGVVTKEATEDETGIRTYTCTICGETKTEEIAKTDHVHNYTAVVTDPTCTTQGYTTYTCAKCGDSYKANYTSALGHNYTSAVTAEPTCTTAGVRTYTCTRCGESYTETIAATGHTVTKHAAVAATCTTTGMKAYYECSVCGKYYSDEACTKETTLVDLTVAALGHSYKDVVTSPTCTTKGYTTHTCTVCGNSYVDSYTDATGHTWDAGTVTTKATCVSKGVKTYTCTVCNETKTEEIAVDSTNHTGNIEIRNRVEATEDSEGYTGDTYCKDCGTLLSKGETIAKLDHVHSYTAVVTAPTCDTQGYTTYTCSKCGNSYKDNYTDALGHTWNVGVVTTKATCVSKGVKTYTCTVCNETKTEEIAIDATNHTGNTVVKNAKDATCGDYGYTGDTYCKDCGTLLAEGSIIDPTGNHTWDDGVVTKEATEIEAGVRTYTCTVCGKTKTEGIDPLGHTTHTWGNEVITKAATCVSTGTLVHTCTVCGETVEVVLPIDSTNHTGSTVVKNAKAATCTATGYTGDTCCKDCGAVLTAGKTISKIAHTYDKTLVDSSKTIKKPTSKATGYYYAKCSMCKSATKKYTTYYQKTVSIAASSYVYTGSAIKPAVTVKDSQGNVIPSSFYTVKYSSNTSVGKAKITITMKTVYSGTLTKTFTIVPKGTSLTSLTAASKAFTAKWTKQSTSTSGYQICYSTSSKFSSPKYVTVSGSSTTSKKVSSLTAKKKYYVRIRTYKTVSGTKYYSSWSSAMSVTTK